LGTVVGTGRPGTEIVGVTFGVDTVGVVSPGVLTPGVVTPGVVTPGVVAIGVDTPGIDTVGTVTPGTETDGTVTGGTVTLGMVGRGGSCAAPALGGCPKAQPQVNAVNTAPHAMSSEVRARIEAVGACCTATLS
jgi:hypothetical protein